MVRPAKLPEKRPGKVGGKRDQNRKQRAEQLSQAALELFLARGIEAVTIDEIAERAGTAKGNFYRYFDDKSALVSTLLVPLATQVRTGMRKCAVDLGRATTGEAVKEAYGRLALVLAMAAIDHRDVVRLYLQEHRAPATESRAALSKLARDLDEGACKLSEAAVRHGVVSVDDPRISALAVVGAVEHLALVILRQEVELSVAEVSTTLIRMVLDGLRPRERA